jgi:hypothetical protein
MGEICSLMHVEPNDTSTLCTRVCGLEINSYKARHKNLRIPLTVVAPEALHHFVNRSAGFVGQF